MNSTGIFSEESEWQNKWQSGQQTAANKNYWCDAFWRWPNICQTLFMIDNTRRRIGSELSLSSGIDSLKFWYSCNQIWPMVADISPCASETMAEWTQMNDQGVFTLIKTVKQCRTVWHRWERAADTGCLCHLLIFSFLSHAHYRIGRSFRYCFVSLSLYHSLGMFCAGCGRGPGRGRRGWPLFSLNEFFS